MSFNPYILLMLLAVIISSFSQILLKKGAQKTYVSLVKEYLNPHVFFGYVLMILATLTNILAYAGGVEYKNGPVIETLGFILVMILSRLVFGEKITQRKLCGNILILVGVIIFYL